MRAMFRFAACRAVTTALVVAGLPVQAKELKVVASIKPVHSLAASLMQGAGKPQLIVAGAASPHAMALKPSQAEAIAAADLVVWIGPQLETFLRGPIKALADKASIVTLQEAPGLVTLELREGGLFEEHEEKGEAAHGHEDHEQFDAHIWLDPKNAAIMAAAIARALAKADPGNAILYKDNLARLLAELATLESEISSAMAALKHGRFIVFHDAYQYFEARFGIAASGAITLNPEAPPGAQRIAEIRQRVRAEAIDCIFSEPQFEPKIVSAILEGTPVRSGVLDPLGSAIEAGPALYTALLQAMAANLTQCLAPR